MAYPGVAVTLVAVKVAAFLEALRPCVMIVVAVDAGRPAKRDGTVDCTLDSH